MNHYAGHGILQFSDKIESLTVFAETPDSVVEEAISHTSRLYCQMQPRMSPCSKRAQRSSLRPHCSQALQYYVLGCAFVHHSPKTSARQHPRTTHARQCQHVSWILDCTLFSTNHITFPTPRMSTPLYYPDPEAHTVHERQPDNTIEKRHNKTQSRMLAVCLTTGPLPLSIF